jgi:uncharacterized protein involved in propanediol utilization
MTSGVRDYPSLDLIGARPARWPAGGEPGPGRTGIGTCEGHHGELLQGRFPDAGNRARQALVTLPCPLFGSTATFHAEPHGPLLASAANVKAAAGARLALRHLGMDGWGGRLSVHSNIPRGRGMGSSTADVVATVRAVANAAGRSLPPEDLATIAVAAESASDSLMYDRPVLFAQRDGVALEVFGLPLPAFTVVGGDLREGGSGVDTLSTPLPRYPVWELAAFQALRGAVRRALTLGNVELLARVSTASARINQRHRPLPGLDRVLETFGAWGALGVQVAHSGTVVGVLCRAGERKSIGQAVRGLRSLGIAEPWSFDAGIS